MFSNIKESALWTVKLFASFFQHMWFGIIALSDWMKGFAIVNKWFFKVFLSKVAIVLIGLTMTPLSVWVLVGLSFLPVPVVMPVFFILFISMFKQF